MILEVRDPSGRTVWKAPALKPTKAVSSQTAFLSPTSWPQHGPLENPIWSEKLALSNGPGGRYRPAAVETGTANDAKDLATYGFLALPKDKKAPPTSSGSGWATATTRRHGPPTRRHH